MHSGPIISVEVKSRRRPGRVLVVNDYDMLSTCFGQLLHYLAPELESLAIADMELATRLLDTGNVDVLVSSLRPFGYGRDHVLTQAKRRWPDLVVILTEGDWGPDDLGQACTVGAIPLILPVSGEYFVETVRAAVALARGRPRGAPGGTT